MRSHHPRRRRRSAMKSEMAWEMFGEMGEALEEEVGIPAEIFAEAAFGMVGSRPLACAICDSPHNDLTSICMSAGSSDDGCPLGPFVLWAPCSSCMEHHNRDLNAMTTAAEPTIDMWLMTHEVPGSVAMIDEDPHECEGP